MHLLRYLLGKPWWLLLLFCLNGLAQNLPDAPSAAGTTAAATAASHCSPTGAQDCPAKRTHQQNHIFWIIPNYRSNEDPDHIKPLTSGQKFKLSLEDSFDPMAFVVAGVFAGMSMAQRQYDFGQGATGFAKYYGGAFADQTIGNIMSEGLFPVALHQDPRYFVRGKGSFWQRTGYAVSREVITRGDDGRNHFNTSELAGNAVAAGISNLYYPAINRSAAGTADKWGQQLALDTAFNVMKEFWPDVRRKLLKK